MSYGQSRFRRMIDRTMSTCPASIRRAGIDRWRIEDAWLVLEYGRGGDFPQGAAAWDLIGRNAGLPGLTKFAWDEASSRSVLRVELPLAGVDEELVRETVLEALGDLATAREMAPPRRRPFREGQRLRELLEESGWPFTERASGAFAVELEGPVPSPRAGLASTPSGGARAAFEVASILAASAASRAAIGSLLLCAGGTLRMVRPFATPKGDRWTVGFEALLGPPLLRATVVREAFSGLSIASRFWTREVRALCDPLFAERVLTVRGWTDPISGSAATIPAISKGGEANGIA